MSIEPIFLNYKNFAKEMMHFGKILVKIFSQTHKLDEFWANFLEPE